MKSFNLMVPIAPEYGECTLEAPYVSSMSHNNGVEIVFKGKSTSKFEESSSINTTTGMGGLNLTLHLVHPLMNLFLVSKT
jgi:hypothetical protein